MQFSKTSIVKLDEQKTDCRLLMRFLDLMVLKDKQENVIFILSRLVLDKLSQLSLKILQKKSLFLKETILYILKRRAYSRAQMCAILCPIYETKGRHNEKALLEKGVRQEKAPSMNAFVRKSAIYECFLSEKGA